MGIGRIFSAWAGLELKKPSTSPPLLQYTVHTCAQEVQVLHGRARPERARLRGADPAHGDRRPGGHRQGGRVRLLPSQAQHPRLVLRQGEEEEGEEEEELRGGGRRGRGTNWLAKYS